jgi:hypothetical protein
MYLAFRGITLGYDFSLHYAIRIIVHIQRLDRSRALC